MKTIWLVTQESNVNGIRLYNVVPCESFEAAKSVFEKEIDTLLNESHYSKFSAEELDRDFTIEDEGDGKFSIVDKYGYYSEYLEIVEKEIVKL